MWKWHQKSQVYFVEIENKFDNLLKKERAVYVKTRINIKDVFW